MNRYKGEFINELLTLLNTLYSTYFLGREARMYFRIFVTFQGIPASLSALLPVC